MTEQQKNNMSLWSKVEKTEKEYVKPVLTKSGKKQFDAVDTMYNIKRMTELFGRCGEGWGYTVSNQQYISHGDFLLFCCDVTLWVGNRTNYFNMPITNSFLISPSPERNLSPL